MNETRALIQCDGAEIPSELDSQSWSYRGPLRSWGDEADLNLRAESLAATVLSSISAYASDLVRLASYVYAADQLMSRGGKADVYGRKWRRRITLCVPVSNPGVWVQDAVQARLRRMLSFLTDDLWQFHFAPVPDHAQHQIPLHIGDPRALVGNPDTVVLFSGGADSLCTTIEAVHEHGLKPVLVSHRPSPPVDARQRELTAALQRQFPQWTFPHLSFWIHRRGGDAADSSQRSRAFLFASLGAAVAAELGISKVLLGDNGVVSLNLPISGQLVGALASRSTHPKFLDLFNALLNELFSGSVQVINPLAIRTRSETLQILQRAGIPQLLQETNSCSRWRGLPAATPHCGYCSQCVDRRFGAIAAGLEEHDLAERYRVNVFVHPLREGEPRTVAESYVRFAQSLKGTSQEDMFLRYQELHDAILPHDPSAARTAEQLTEMLRRHAQTVLGVVSEMIGRYRSELAENTLPADCLLRLVVAQVEHPTDRSTPEYAFFPDGDSWRVVYRGVGRSFHNSKGLRYIARLLRHPGQEFHALDLSQDLAPQHGPIDPFANHYADSDDLLGGELSGRSLQSRDSQELIDARARQELGDALVQLQTQLTDGADRLSNEQRKSIERDMEFIRRELDHTKNIHGRARSFSDDAERARKAVSASIRRALDNMAKFHPDLYRHLDSSITTGNFCSYCHEPPLDWHF